MHIQCNSITFFLLLSCIPVLDWGCQDWIDVSVPVANLDWIDVSVPVANLEASLIEDKKKREGDNNSALKTSDI